MSDVKVKILKLTGRHYLLLGPDHLGSSRKVRGIGMQGITMDSKEPVTPQISQEPGASQTGFGTLRSWGSRWG